MAPGIVLTFVMFVTIWCLTLFAVLPIGVRQAEERGPGHDTGAPHDPMLKRKFLWTTAIALLVTLTVWLSMGSGWLRLRP